MAKEKVIGDASSSDEEDKQPTPPWKQFQPKKSPAPKQEVKKPVEAVKSMPKKKETCIGDSSDSDEDAAQKIGDVKKDPPSTKNSIPGAGKVAPQSKPAPVKQPAKATPPISAKTQEKIIGGVAKAMSKVSEVKPQVKPKNSGVIGDDSDEDDAPPPVAQKQKTKPEPKPKPKIAEQKPQNVAKKEQDKIVGDTDSKIAVKIDTPPASTVIKEEAKKSDEPKPKDVVKEKPKDVIKEKPLDAIKEKPKVEVTKPTPEKVIKVPIQASAPVPKKPKSGVIGDDSSDDEEQQQPIAKPVAQKPAKTKILGDSSDEEDRPEPAIQKKPAPVKTKVFGDSSDEEDRPEPAVQKKPAPVKTKVFGDSSDEEDAAVPVTQQIPAPSKEKALGDSSDEDSKAAPIIHPTPAPPNEKVLGDSSDDNEKPVVIEESSKPATPPKSSNEIDSSTKADAHPHDSHSDEDDYIEESKDKAAESRMNDMFEANIKSTKPKAIRNTISTPNNFKSILAMQIARQSQEMLNKGKPSKLSKEVSDRPIPIPILGSGGIKKKALGSLLRDDDEGEDDVEEFAKTRGDKIKLDDNLMPIEHLEFNKPKMSRRVSKRKPVKF